MIYEQKYFTFPWEEASPESDLQHNYTGVAKNR